MPVKIVLKIIAPKILTYYFNKIQYFSHYNDPLEPLELTRYTKFSEEYRESTILCSIIKEKTAFYPGPELYRNIAFSTDGLRTSFYQIVYIILLFITDSD